MIQSSLVKLPLQLVKVCLHCCFDRVSTIVSLSCCACKKGLCNVSPRREKKKTRKQKNIFCHVFPPQAANDQSRCCYCVLTNVYGRWNFTRTKLAPLFTAVNGTDLFPVCSCSNPNWFLQHLSGTNPWVEGSVRSSEGDWWCRRTSQSFTNEVLKTPYLSPSVWFVWAATRHMRRCLKCVECQQRVGVIYHLKT